MNHFADIVKKSNELKLKQEEAIYERYGFVYFAPPDGWIKKCRPFGDDSFEGMLENYSNANIEVGKLICCGWLRSDKEFYIYKITEVKKAFLPGAMPTVYGEEVECFKPCFGGQEVDLSQRKSREMPCYKAWLKRIREVLKKYARIK